MFYRLVTFLVLIVFFANEFSIAQKELKLTLDVKCDFLAVDHLGQIYAVDGSSIGKYNPRGKLQYTYSNSMAGSIHSLDVSNPLRILVFYRDQNQVVFLNQQMAEITNPINFDDLNIYEISVACNSENNRFWIFHNETFQLWQFDKNLNVVQKSQSLLTLLKDESEILQLVEHNQRLYLNISGKGIYVFDEFGTFLHILALKDIQSFSARSDLITYIDQQHKLHTYNLESKTIKQVDLTLPYTIHHFAIANGQIYTTSGKQIFVY